MEKDGRVEKIQNERNKIQLNMFNSLRDAHAALRDAHRAIYVTANALDAVLDAFDALLDAIDARDALGTRIGEEKEKHHEK